MLQGGKRTTPFKTLGVDNYDAAADINTPGDEHRSSPQSLAPPSASAAAAAAKSAADDHARLLLEHSVRELCGVVVGHLQLMGMRSSEAESYGKIDHNSNSNSNSNNNNVDDLQAKAKRSLKSSAHEECFNLARMLLTPYGDLLSHSGGGVGAASSSSSSSATTVVVAAAAPTNQAAESRRSEQKKRTLCMVGALLQAVANACREDAKPLSSSSSSSSSSSNHKADDDAEQRYVPTLHFWSTLAAAHFHVWLLSGLTASSRRLVLSRLSLDHAFQHPSSVRSRPLLELDASVSLYGGDLARGLRAAERLAELELRLHPAVLSSSGVGSERRGSRVDGNAGASEKQRAGFGNGLLVLLAMCCAGLGRYDDAAKFLKEELTDPSKPYADYEIALLLGRIYDKSSECAENGGGDFADVEDDQNDSFMKAEEAGLDMAQRSANRYRQAYNVARKKGRAPDHTNEEGRPAWRSWVDSGKCWKHLAETCAIAGHFHFAVDCYQMALEKSMGGKDLGLWFGLAKCLFRSGNIPDAMIAAKRAHELDENDRQVARVVDTWKDRDLKERGLQVRLQARGQTPTMAMRTLAGRHTVAAAASEAASSAVAEAFSDDPLEDSSMSLIDIVRAINVAYGGEPSLGKPAPPPPLPPPAAEAEPPSTTEGGGAGAATADGAEGGAAAAKAANTSGGSPTAAGGKRSSVDADDNSSTGIMIDDEPSVAFSSGAGGEGGGGSSSSSLQRQFSDGIMPFGIFSQNSMMSGQSQDSRRSDSSRIKAVVTEQLQATVRKNKAQREKFAKLHYPELDETAAAEMSVLAGAARAQQESLEPPLPIWKQKHLQQNEAKRLALEKHMKKLRVTKKKDEDDCDLKPFVPSYVAASDTHLLKSIERSRSLGYPSSTAQAYIRYWRGLFDDLACRLLNERELRRCLFTIRCHYPAVSNAAAFVALAEARCSVEEACARLCDRKFLAEIDMVAAIVDLDEYIDLRDGAADSAPSALLLAGPRPTTGSYYSGVVGGSSSTVGSTHKAARPGTGSYVSALPPLTLGLQPPPFSNVPFAGADAASIGESTFMGGLTIASSMELDGGAGIVPWPSSSVFNSRVRTAQGCKRTQDVQRSYMAALSDPNLRGKKSPIDLMVEVMAAEARNSPARTVRRGAVINGGSSEWTEKKRGPANDGLPLTTNRSRKAAKSKKKRL